MAFDLLDDAPPSEPQAPAVAEAPAVPEVNAAIQTLKATAVLASVALAACGGGGGGAESSTLEPNDAVPAPLPGRTVALRTTGYNYLPITSDAQAARFLMQAQFSASTADITAVRSQGYANWMQGQIQRDMGILGWDWLNSQGYGTRNASVNYDGTAQTDYMLWNQLMAAPDPMRKRMALALSEFFVVSTSGVSLTWASHAMAHYWDTLCIHALGNYRDLLGAITLNVAMGYYLNTRGNRKENSAGRQPDENYAREVMQLFSIGLINLNMNGTPALDGNGDTVSTYTSSDVSNLARVFTGYDVDQSTNDIKAIPQSSGSPRNVGNKNFARLPMVLRQSDHSTLASTFLGVTIAANTPAADALKTALDTLFNHPNTAPFFCKQMIQRLVTSNPSPAYVGRVAAVFVNNGAGVRGDLAQVFAAILLDDEARAPAGLSDVEYGKVREPMVRFAQWARTFGVSSTSGAWRIGDQSNAGSALAQSPLRSPSVFNFFRPGYVPPGSTLTAGKVAPEFQLVSESSVGGYLNFMLTVIDSGLNSSDIRAAYTTELALSTLPTAASPTDLVERLNLLLCAGQLSTTTVNTIVATVGAMAGVVANTTTTALNRRRRVCAAVLMVMASAEYLVQK